SEERRGSPWSGRGHDEQQDADRHQTLHADLLVFQTTATIGGRIEHRNVVPQDTARGLTSIDTRTPRKRDKLGEDSAEGSILLRIGRWFPCWRAAGWPLSCCWRSWRPRRCPSAPPGTAAPAAWRWVAAACTRPR